MQALRSVLDRARDTWAPVTHTSTFRQTGQITPEEFVSAGDYLVYKFPSWSWSGASTPAKAVAYLPAEKQYLVTRGVPCRRRLDENFAGEKGLEEAVVKDGFEGEGEEDGWLRTGGGESAKVGDVRTLEGSRGDISGEVEEEEEIPDMEDDDDDEEAIIRDPKGKGGNAPLRTYNIYITYTPYYRTPRLYLSGYSAPSVPLPPSLMLEDIVGDYKDKTVTLEDFPFFDTSVKMASVHPCKHASVMKVLLDRADAAMKIRKARIRQGGKSSVAKGMEGLVDDTKGLSIKDKGFDKGVSVAGGGQGDEWEVLEQGADEDEEVAIRVDQYVVVFLKFMASVTPGIEHDQTMGV